MSSLSGHAAVEHLPVSLDMYSWFLDSHCPNEPVEKVTFLKTASSAGSKIENYFLPSKVFPILGEMFVFS